MDRIAALCIGLLVTATAGAADRKFEPVPQSSMQHVQAANGLTIISTSGQKLGAGASISASNSRKAWLSVSVKNTGRAPVGFSDAAVVVTSGGEKLGLRVVGTKENIKAEQLGVSQLVARQYQVDLPKKAKREAVTLNVTITLDGEAINFVFMQAD